MKAVLQYSITASEYKQLADGCEEFKIVVEAIPEGTYYVDYGGTDESVIGDMLALGHMVNVKTLCSRLRYISHNQLLNAEYRRFLMRMLTMYGSLDLLKYLRSIPDDVIPDLGQASQYLLYDISVEPFHDPRLDIFKILLKQYQQSNANAYGHICNERTVMMDIAGRVDHIVLAYIECLGNTFIDLYLIQDTLWSKRYKAAIDMLDNFPTNAKYYGSYTGRLTWLIKRYAHEPGIGVVIGKLVKLYIESMPLGPYIELTFKYIPPASVNPTPVAH